MLDLSILHYDELKTKSDLPALHSYMHEIQEVGGLAFLIPAINCDIIIMGDLPGHFSTIMSIFTQNTFSDIFNLDGIQRNQK